VARKSDEDREVEERIRAHIRQQMHDRGIDKAEAARRVKSDNGNFSRILSGDRGIGPGLILRICKAFRITPTRLLEEDPPRAFFVEGSEDATA
jgi:transcriptional regulator with XRE-family HTH domain